MKPHGEPEVFGHRSHPVNLSDGHIHESEEFFATEEDRKVEHRRGTSDFAPFGLGESEDPISAIRRVPLQQRRYFGRVGDAAEVSICAFGQFRSVVSGDGHTVCRRFKDFAQMDEEEAVNGLVRMFTHEKFGTVIAGEGEPPLPPGDGAIRCAPRG